MSFSIKSHDEFIEFYLRTYHAMTGFCNKFLPDSFAAEDIVQDSFLKLYGSRDKFAREDETRAWLYVSVRNMCLDHIRHNKFNGGEIYDNLTSEDSFLDEITRQESFRALREAIGVLPPQMRRIATLASQGKSNSEIAEEMGLSVNSVKTLKKYAYKKLRHALGGHNSLILLFFL